MTVRWPVRAGVIVASWCQPERVGVFLPIVHDREEIERWEVRKTSVGAITLSGTGPPAICDRGAAHGARVKSNHGITANPADNFVLF